MENPNYYAVIPAKVRYDKNLRANEKLLYGEITALASKDGECWASNSYFSELYGVVPSAISKWIKDLEEHGYISIEYVRKENSKEIDRRVIKLVEVVTFVNTGSHKCRRGYSQMKKENNTSINNNKKKKEDLKKIIDFYENNITLITEFVAEDMEKYLENGLEANLIIAAMQEAVIRNKRNWKYVASILNNCIDNRIKTEQQFKIEQEEFKSNKKQPKKEKAKEKTEYKEVEMTEEEYKKKLFEKGKEDV